MQSIEPMLATHPQPSSVDRGVLLECLEACHDCAAACTICADACLAEDQVQMLRSCIRLNLDCAAVCETTAAVLSRQTGAADALARAQVEACLQACRLCGDECSSHAGHHEHCRVCAESCRRCAEACNRLLQALGR
jgi:hypothetical protein